MGICSAKIEDIPRLMEMAEQALSAPQWTLAHYENAAQDPSCNLVLVVEEDDGIQGFVIASGAHKDWELLNIVVAGKNRRKGTATQLIQELTKVLKSHHVENLFLEVRESNNVAIALYKKLGFQLSGRRKSYYENPTEDALLFHMGLTD